MTILGELLKQGKKEEVWQRCCGFIDLSMYEFMQIQRRLLLEQLTLLKKCELGRYIFNGANPSNVEEFREMVPLTTYADYAPYLLRRQKSILPERPLLWQHTSGRSGEYAYKWVPLSKRQYEEMGPVFLSSFIFSTCKHHGDVNLKIGYKHLDALAPPPYLTGVIGRRLVEEGIFDVLPPLNEAEKMEYVDRIKLGFKMAMMEGLDTFGGMSSILVSMAEKFSEGGGYMDIKPFLRKPDALFRLAKGVAKSKMAGRPIMPKDIWSLKGIVAGGADTTVFRDKIKDMWGCYPLNIYACTEALVIAEQTWDFGGMTFLPNLNFLEFIPETESLKLRDDPTYKPHTLLLNEVKADQNYELVFTNLLGGSLVRYRNGDMIKIISLRNENLNIDLPQMEFHSRVDDLIDIAGFTRLTERIIWQAVERAGVDCVEWTARKESTNTHILHIYLEIKGNNNWLEDDIATRIHQQLKSLDKDWSNIESLLGLSPVEVTILPRNSFDAYRAKQQSAGADLAHLKIPHINPTENTLNFLMSTTRQPTPPVVVSQSDNRRERVVSR